VQLIAIETLRFHHNSRVIARNGRNMTLTVTNAGLEFEASLLAADDRTYQRGQGSTIRAALASCPRR
jgi:hypothetical protein